MGLDMYLYRIRKPTDEELAPLLAKPDLTADDLEEAGFATLTAPLDDDCKTLEPYTAVVHCQSSRYVNLAQIRKDFQIPDNANVVSEGYGKQRVSYTFDNYEDFRMELAFTDAQLERYLFRQEEDLYVFAREEVLYWRKFYPLQNAIHDIFYRLNGRSLENCEYWPATDEVLELMYHPEKLYAEYAKTDDDRERIGWRVDAEREDPSAPPELGDNEALVYWEWY